MSFAANFAWRFKGYKTNQTNKYFIALQSHNIFTLYSYITWHAHQIIFGSVPDLQIA